MDAKTLTPHTDRNDAGNGTPGRPGRDDLLNATLTIGGERQEPRWLSELRREALESYFNHPLPDRVSHLWRYSDPDRFLPPWRKGRAVAPTGSTNWPPEILKLLESGEIAGAALVEGGELARLSLGSEVEKAGIVIQDLHTAARERPDILQQHLGSMVRSETGKYEALNGALWEGGILVYAPPGTRISRPIHLWKVAGSALEFPRLLIIAGEGAELTVIDEYLGGPTPGKGESSGNGGPPGAMVHAVIETFAGPSARIRQVTVQRLAENTTLHLAQRARADRDARVLSVLASLGGKVSKADLGTLLTGRGAEVELLSFLFGTGRQHFDHHTVHDHRAPDTRSNLDFKVVLRDRARSAYTGLIRVAGDAPRSEAYQENRNLLLSDGCKADSIPELEIMTDEVMCTHGATMGSLDPEHLFYLLSRGIPRPEARRMIIEGFIEPTLNRVPEDLKDRLRKYVEQALS